MKPIKVLFAHGGTLEKAGTEAYMMSVFRNVDPNKVHIDFLVFGCKEGHYDKEVITKGGKIFRIPLTPHDFLGNYPSRKTILKMLEKEQYDIIHSHMNALNPLLFRSARKIGIPYMISHSHGSRHFVDNVLLIKYKDQLMKKIPDYADVLLACSKEAGDFLYPDQDYTIMNNGIDLEQYEYNEVTRKRLRKELKLDDQLVFGHIGRFNFQKNHKFLIEVFAEILKTKPNAILALAGEGELLDDVKNQVKNLGIEDHVKFLGLRDDIPDVLQVLDVFMLPSVFEGLPYVLVEAQAAGLLCFASDTIDRQSALTDNFHFLPIDNPHEWSDYIVGHVEYERRSTREQLIEKGFDEKVNVKKLEQIYVNLVKK
ncbi:glycosyltransferase family 1 protein [Erysipelothrix rhusiopathiae]|nr:glycosyltransferase family 1 protein [Erysipelothrix rhusiopathiae]MDE8079906.1 glycosyltransferase family 1 protein [Erysipelothrix rhusiopathiae]MDE8082503.1 glycosyltransferase family 1 protein [Erysipelothrix rhusiopathiae]MDE8084471.1 glycosyltransferase family 1 protein [Erysipelothrix rhusiopathiae]MDE8088021.1 glycosyltransferase family 1 protein [Erysipelothrix rhusiopathiae]